MHVNQGRRQEHTPGRHELEERVGIEVDRLLMIERFKKAHQVFTKNHVEPQVESICVADIAKGST